MNTFEKDSKELNEVIMQANAGLNENEGYTYEIFKNSIGNIKFVSLFYNKEWLGTFGSIESIIDTLNE